MDKKVKITYYRGMKDSKLMEKLYKEDNPAAEKKVTYDEVETTKKVTYDKPERKTKKKRKKKKYSPKDPVARKEYDLAFMKKYGIRGLTKNHIHECAKSYNIFLLLLNLWLFPIGFFYIPFYSYRIRKAENVHRINGTCQANIIAGKIMRIISIIVTTLWIIYAIFMSNESTRKLVTDFISYLSDKI